MTRRRPSLDDPAAPFACVDTEHVLPHMHAAEHGECGARASSDGAQFGFPRALLPLHPTHDDSGDSNVLLPQVRVSQAKIGLLGAMSLTVGLQVGSGIFSSPGIVTAYTGSVGASMLVWIASAMLALTGASSYAELATAIPLNGGAQAYLQPSSGAIIATILGEYLTRVLLHVFDGGADDFHKFTAADLPQAVVKSIAAICAVVLFSMQICSPKTGTRVQVVVTAGKLLLLASIPVIALVVALQGRMPAASRAAFSSVHGLFQGSTASLSRYALALYSGLWAFDGWDQCSFVAGDMRQPKRDIPVAIHGSIAIVAASFVAAVVSYFVVISPEGVAQTNSVALDFGSAAFGFVGGVLFAGVVAFSCIGALNGHLFTYTRLIVAAGRERFLPARFGELSKRMHTPVYASLLSLCLVLAFVFLGSGFASLINFCGVCSWFWYGATVLGLLYLRVKEPHLERPYRTWLITPVAFVTMSLFLLVMPVFAAPLEALAAFAFIAAGIPLYYLTQTDALLYFRRAGFAAVPTNVVDLPGGE
ncbi:hypothetical protein MSPP1_002689 [Malassezia sp. CBS 17886]|nr:hypothetical protein MSPP1_002689 [Malassezia sp. CBS 17886]